MIDLIEHNDPFLKNELRIRSCVLGDHRPKLEATEAEYRAFDARLAEIIFAPDHFAALGLPRSAHVSDGEVIRAVKKALIRAHPDRHIKREDSYDPHVVPRSVEMRDFLGRA